MHPHKNGEISKVQSVTDKYNHTVELIGYFDWDNTQVSVCAT